MMIPGCAPVPANGLFEGVPPECALLLQIKQSFDQSVYLNGLGDLGCPGKECHCHLQDEGSPGLGDWSAFFNGVSEFGANAELGFSNVASDLSSAQWARAGSEALAAVGASASSLVGAAGGLVSGVTGSIGSVSSSTWLLGGAAILGVMLFNRHKATRGRAPRRRKK